MPARSGLASRRCRPQPRANKDDMKTGSSSSLCPRSSRRPTSSMEGGDLADGRLVLPGVHPQVGVGLMMRGTNVSTSRIEWMEAVREFREPGSPTLPIATSFTHGVPWVVSTPKELSTWRISRRRWRPGRARTARGGRGSGDRPEERARGPSPRRARAASPSPRRVVEPLRVGGEVVRRVSGRRGRRRRARDREAWRERPRVDAPRDHGRRRERRDAVDGRP